MTTSRNDFRHIVTESSQDFSENPTNRDKSHKLATLKSVLSHSCSALLVIGYPKTAAPQMTKIIITTFASITESLAPLYEFPDLYVRPCSLDLDLTFLTKKTADENFDSCSVIKSKCYLNNNSINDTRVITDRFHFCRCYQRFLRTQIVEFFERGDLFMRAQFIFRSDKSTSLAIETFDKSYSR